MMATPPHHSAISVVARAVLETIGATEGQACLDFGCGHGNYAIPLAHLVGPYGMVYALDKDEAELQRLAESAKAAELLNIKVMVSSGKVALPLGDGCLDLVLLYDVLHGYYFSTGQREALFHEVKRVSKPGALLSVFPRHMADDEVVGEVVERLARAGFEVHDEYQGPVVHDDTVTGGHILTFRKVTERGRSFPSAADRRVPEDSLVREGA